MSLAVAVRPKSCSSGGATGTTPGRRFDGDGVLAVSSATTLFTAGFDRDDLLLIGAPPWGVVDRRLDIRLGRSGFAVVVAGQLGSDCASVRGVGRALEHGEQGDRAVVLPRVDRDLRQREDAG
jgi:hypothetical protein